MAYKQKGWSAFTAKDDDKKKYQTSDSDTIRVPNKYNVGDWVGEDDFEDQFEKIEGDPKTFPQYSIQDYSKVKKDEKGKYVVRLKDD